MNNDDWARFGLEIARDRALDEKYKLSKQIIKYECLNCWKGFGVLNSRVLKLMETDFCSPDCKKEYKNGFQEIPILDGTPRDFIRNDGLEMYEPDCYAINPDILKEAETYELSNRYNLDYFRFFALLNKTRSGQFKNKWSK
tara:strand:+ start:52 stop:474 length:423 start_codon:yes stop_codon:yes gene_type:complete